MLNQNIKSAPDIQDIFIFLTCSCCSHIQSRRGSLEEDVVIKNAVSHLCTPPAEVCRNFGLAYDHQRLDERSCPPVDLLGCQERIAGSVCLAQVESCQEHRHVICGRICGVCLVNHDVNLHQQQD